MESNRSQNKPQFTIDTMDAEKIVDSTIKLIEEHDNFEKRLAVLETDRTTLMFGDYIEYFNNRFCAQTKPLTSWELFAEDLKQERLEFYRDVRQTGEMANLDQERFQAMLKKKPCHNQIISYYASIGFSMSQYFLMMNAKHDRNTLCHRTEQQLKAEFERDLARMSKDSRMNALKPVFEVIGKHFRKLKQIN